MKDIIPREQAVSRWSTREVQVAMFMSRDRHDSAGNALDTRGGQPISGRSARSRRLLLGRVAKNTAGWRERGVVVLVVVTGRHSYSSFSPSSCPENTLTITERLSAPHNISLNHCQHTRHERIPAPGSGAGTNVELETAISPLPTLA